MFGEEHGMEKTLRMKKNKFRKEYNSGDEWTSIKTKESCLTILSFAVLLFTLIFRIKALPIHTLIV